jgi:hypothetical protein
MDRAANLQWRPAAVASSNCCIQVANQLIQRLTARLISVLPAFVR